MNRSFGMCAIALTLGSVAGCDEAVEQTPDGGGPAMDADAREASPGEEAGSDAAREPAAFLPTTAYAELLALAPSFPFGVTEVHAVAGAVKPATWGNHRGPLVTADLASAPIKAVRYALPSGATADATVASTTALPSVSGAPTPVFFSYLGLVDVDSARTLYSYTGTASPAQGELLLLDSVLAVKGRARVNGIYDHKPWVMGSDTFVIYTGFSAPTATASSTNTNGLYIAQLCADGFVPTGTCRAAFPLVTWSGASGPVVTDTQGTVVVAGYLAGDKPDVIYAVSKAQVADAIRTGTTLPLAPFADGSTGGNNALAAIAPEGSAPGWIVVLGYAPSVAAKAIPYIVGASAITKPAGEIEDAIQKGTAATDMHFLTDDMGDLWVAVQKATGGAFVKLRRK